MDFLSSQHQQQYNQNAKLPKYRWSRNRMENPEATLGLLRQKMQEKHLDYYLAGSSDPHNNEYVPTHWRYLEEVSGFSGSLGYLLVSQDFAGLWVDSRYHIQAERECPAQIQVFRLGKLGVPQLCEFWREQLVNEAKYVCLGFDGSSFSPSNLNKLLPISASFDYQVNSSSLQIDELWLDGRPPLPETDIFSYRLEYCGQSRVEKLQQVRFRMAECGFDYYPTALLDNIAWLLNVRACDIAYNPVAISYLILGQKLLRWYVAEPRLSQELKTELFADIPELEIRPYCEFYTDCQKLAQTPLAETYENLSRPSFLLTDRCNIKLLDILLSEVTERSPMPLPSMYLKKGSSALPYSRDIITDFKALKNQTEQAQLRRVMALDGAAFSAFHNWLRPLPSSGQISPLDLDSSTSAAVTEQRVDEYMLGQKIMQFRSEIAGELGKGESFAPIVGFRANSALPHYSASAHSCEIVHRQGGWLLIDSGGQYLGGTTDMTRSFSLEEDFAAPRFDRPSSIELRQLYTLVLKGHLRLQNIRFPRATIGAQLDSIARSPLWLERLDYQHGTGHGVGSFLNVHEGPASIGSSPLNEPLQAGMLLSNEPGCYLEGEFGIRIENLLLVQVDEQNPNWLCFETMTMFPYERELICIEELSPSERLWVDQYHAKCLAQISATGKLNTQQEAWLRVRCAPLETV